MTTFPPHTLRQFLKTGKATLVLPMEPQPMDGVVKFFVHANCVQGLDDRGFSCGDSIAFPCMVGDVLTIDGETIHTVLMGEPVTMHMQPYATVASVEAEKVAEMDADEAFAAIRELSPDMPMGWFERAWNWENPRHPFDTAWAWLIRVEKP